MAFVSVPKDLSKVKTKFAFNLTKRQLICFSTAAFVGIPTYLFTRSTIGNSAAALLMIGLMLPFFMLAQYEKTVSQRKFYFVIIFAHDFYGAEYDRIKQKIFMK